MKALVLSALAVDGERGAVALGALDAVLRERALEIESADVSVDDIHPCRACGSCSHKTPGRCVIKDDMQGIYPRIVTSDALVLAAPIRFGAHHSALKRVLDRFQPLMVPFYVIRDGEMKFGPRYKRRPVLLGVGLLPPEGLVEACAEEEAYRRLIERHASNLGVPRHGAAVLSTTGSEADAVEAIRAALDAVGIAPVRGGVRAGAQGGAKT